MFSLLRSALGSWLAKIFLGLLVIAFAVWGVSGSLVTGVGSSVVTVGSTRVGLTEYRLAYDRQINMMSRQLGTRLTREQAEAFGISQNVLSQIVSGAVLDETARRMGLGVSRERLATMIGKDESFRDESGRFSRLQLEQALRSVGMSQEAYVQTRKQAAVRSQLIDAGSAGLELPDALWNILSEAQGEKRVFEYFVLEPGMIAPVGTPDEAALKEWYDTNLARYVAPEYRKLKLVKLEANDIADDGAVTEDEIAEEYEAAKAGFTVAEKRTIEQLVFASADEAAAALQKIRDGESFETVVTAQGKSLTDISLGMLERSGIPDAKIAEAAFTLSLNQVSDVVEGVFGPVLLRVTEIRPQTVKPLEEVAEELRHSIALRKATEALFDVHDRLEDERAAGEPLEKAAEAVGLKARVVEAVDRNSRAPDGTVINDLPESKKLLEEAFITDEGVETDPISIGADGFVWFEVEAVTPERQKTLEEVRDQAIADWQADATGKAVSTLAETVRDRVAGGETFEAVLGEVLPGRGDETPWPVQVSAPLLRSDTSSDLDAEAVAAGYGVGKDGMAIASKDQAKIILKVREVQPGSAGNVQTRLRNQLNEGVSDDLVTGLVGALRGRYDIGINQQAINLAIGN